jgi:hypothetical protein
MLVHHLGESYCTNRGHPHEQIALDNAVISAFTYLPQAISQICSEENKKETEMRMIIFGPFHGM